MTAAPLLVGCALHDGADIDACGCPALDSPGAIAYRGLLVKARAEIARLTAELDAARAEVNCGQDGPCVKAPGCARHWQERNRELADELAAARAVPADVEAAIEELRRAEEVDARAMTGQSLAARVLAEANLRTAIARAIRDATAARGTVGGLLATAPVGSIVECSFMRSHRQVRATGFESIEQRWYADGAWSDWYSLSYQFIAFQLPARLVPASEADADPDTRGPLSGDSE